MVDGKMDFNKEHEQFIKDQNRDMKVFIEGAKPHQDPTSAYSMKLAEEQFMKENNVIKS